MMKLIVIILSCLHLSSAGFRVRKIEALTSTIPGSGMDKPTISIKFLGYSNGGTFSVQIIKGDQNCRTNMLNTEDNNWELGQTDWFVGRQIHECYGFELKNSSDVKLWLYHTGSDSGTLEYIRIHSWHTASSFVCPINQRLDYNEKFLASCKYEEHGDDQDELAWCNGSSEFCNLKFNQFLFPGTHNAGTGQSNGFLPCASKNQDLNITEQLDFGIRVFDLDTIYSHGLSGCDGLETGHGAVPEVGIYQCYGKVDELMDEVKNWLGDHRSEVIVLYFGGIAFKETTVPILVEVIKQKLEPVTGLRLNTDYKTTGEWPTLKSAVQQNSRVFVFVRDSRVEQEKGIIEDVKVKPTEFEERLNGSAVTMLSSYEAGNVGSDCTFVLDSTQEACIRSDVDLIKLSLFSSYFKSGVDCLWDIARKCNKLTEKSIQLCTREFEKSLNGTQTGDSRRFAPNFVLLDYPNYQTTQALSFIQLCQRENLRRAAVAAQSSQSDAI